VLVKQELVASDVVAGNRRLAIFASATVPTGQTEADGDDLAPPLQLGSGTPSLRGEAVYSHVQGRWGIHGGVGYTAPAGSNQGVRPGDRFSVDLALGYRVLPSRFETLREASFGAYVELNGTVAQPNSQGGSRLEDTGAWNLFVSPGLQLIPRPNLALEASLQLPALRRPRGTQLMADYSLAFGVRTMVGPLGR
jgi:hypothetical protein